MLAFYATFVGFYVTLVWFSCHRHSQKMILKLLQALEGLSEEYNQLMFHLTDSKNTDLSKQREQNLEKLKQKRKTQEQEQEQELTTPRQKREADKFHSLVKSAGKCFVKNCEIWEYFEKQARKLITTFESLEIPTGSFELSPGSLSGRLRKMITGPIYFRNLEILRSKSTEMGVRINDLNETIRNHQSERRTFESTLQAVSNVPHKKFEQSGDPISPDGSAPITESRDTRHFDVIYHPRRREGLLPAEMLKC